MPYCGHCGETIGADNKFCEACGASITRQGEPASGPEAQSQDTNYRHQNHAREKGETGSLITGKTAGIALTILLAVATGLAARYYWNCKVLEEKLTLGQDMIEQGDYDQAIVSFHEATYIDEDNVMANIGLIRAYERAGRHSDSRDRVQFLDKEVGVANMSAAEVILLARFYIDSVQYDKAVKLVEDARKVVPSDEQLIDFQRNMAFAGNNQGNIMNGGFVSMYEDWIYYVDYKDGLYRIRTDGTGKDKICSDDAFYINPTGEWIYYVNAEDGFLYRIRPDGSGRQKLGNDDCSVPVLYKDYIYYLADGGNKRRNMLHRVRKDGTEQQQMTYDVSLHGFGFIDEQVFFPAGNEILCKVNDDGKDWQQLWSVKEDSKGHTLDQELGIPVIIGEQIYGIYLTEEEGIGKTRSISCFTPDGLLDKTIYTAGQSRDIWGFNTDGNMVVYYDENQGVIKRIDVDGSNAMTLTEPGDLENVGLFSPASLCLLDGWVYYFTNHGEPATSGIYRTSLDGTNTEKLSDWGNNNR